MTAIGTAAALAALVLGLIQLGRCAVAHRRGDQHGSPPGRRWAVLDRVDAPDINYPERDHMVRWRIVQTPWFGVYVHRINTPDDTRPIPHTHPWPFVSVILRGGYDEYIERHHSSGLVRCGERIRRVGTVHLVRTIDAHTITALRRSPTWTLLLVGRRRHEPSWGYWDRYRFTPWNEHPYAQAFAAALHARHATAAQDRLQAEDQSRPAQPHPVGTGSSVEDGSPLRRDDT